MTENAPKTLLEKYTREREMLYSILSKIGDAITSLASDSVQSYSLGNRSVSYADIDKLKALREETQTRIEEIEGMLSGRSARNVTTNVFLDPSFVLPRW